MVTQEGGGPSCAVTLSIGGETRDRAAWLFQVVFTVMQRGGERDYSPLSPHFYRRLLCVSHIGGGVEPREARVS